MQLLKIVKNSGSKVSEPFAFKTFWWGWCSLRQCHVYISRGRRVFVIASYFVIYYITWYLVLSLRKTVGKIGSSPMLSFPAELCCRKIGPSNCLRCLASQNWIWWGLLRANRLAFRTFWISNKNFRFYKLPSLWWVRNLRDEPEAGLSGDETSFLKLLYCFFIPNIFAWRSVERSLKLWRLHHGVKEELPVCWE